MDYIAGLVQRGLISPDVAQGLIQQVANIQRPGVPSPPLEAGGTGGQIGASTTRQPLLGTAESGFQWIPRRQLDQGMNYNPRIVPDEPLLEKAPAGESPRYLQEKAWRNRVGDRANDARRRRAQQKDQEQ